MTTTMTEARKPGRPYVVQDIAAAQDPDALLTVHTVATMTGFAEATIREWAREGTHNFPAAKKLGPRTVRWRAGDVREWLKSAGVPT
jgi:predicted DNA-binding transcriptional regulator AlpA